MSGFGSPFDSGNLFGSPLPGPGFGDPLGGWTEGTAFLLYPWNPLDPNGHGGPGGLAGYVDGSGDAPNTYAPTVLPFEYGDSGGALVTMRLAGEAPTRGPFKAWLSSADGHLWGPCYSAVAGQGTDVYLNRSGELLAFALPPLPLGTYGVTLTWDSGTGRADSPASLLVVPEATYPLADWAIEAWGD